MVLKLVMSFVVKHNKVLNLLQKREEKKRLIHSILAEF